MPSNPRAGDGTPTCSGRRAVAIAAALLGLQRRFQRQEGGVLSVEFSLLLPFMLALLWGGIELTAGLSAKRRVAMSVSTLADLTTNTKLDYVHESTVTDILDATAAVMRPYGIDSARQRVTAVTWEYTNPLQPALGGRYVTVWSRERTGSGVVTDTTEAGYNRGDTFTDFGSHPILASGEHLVGAGQHIVIATIGYAYDIGLTDRLGVFQIKQTEVRLPRYEPTLAFCESNRPGADCTDGRNWDETNGVPD